jgi:hypothetical protein
MVCHVRTIASARGRGSLFSDANGDEGALDHRRIVAAA